MKITLHLVSDEKLEVIDPASGNKVIVHNLAFDVAGGDPGTFATSPSGVIHLNNVSESAAAAFAVGQDYLFSEVVPTAPVVDAPAGATTGTTGTTTAPAAAPGTPGTPAAAAPAT